MWESEIRTKDEIGEVGQRSSCWDIDRDKECGRDMQENKRYEGREIGQSYMLLRYR